MTNLKINTNHITKTFERIRFHGRRNRSKVIYLRKFYLTNLTNSFFSKNGFSDGTSENKTDLNLSSGTQEEAQEKQLTEGNFDVTKTNESEKNEKKQPVEQTGKCYWYNLNDFKHEK